MSSLSKSSSASEDDSHINHDPDLPELRRGPWTLEEDSLLIHSIACHGEGRWNLLAKRAGLRRTGKSCRLRWLNYLKPDVKRGNLTPQEQLLILDLHSKLGNRWSKIAQHLPGRTDNEIKNYWRTRVQKQARHLKVDANSTAFQEIVKCFWMPRLLQKMQCSSTATTSSSSPLLSQKNPTVAQSVNHVADHNSPLPTPAPPLPSQQEVPGQGKLEDMHSLDTHEHNSDSEHGSNSCKSSTESMNISQAPQLSEYPANPFHAMANNSNYSSYVKDYYYDDSSYYNMETVNLANLPACGGFENPVRVVPETDWLGCDFADNYMWNMEDFMAT